MGRIQTGTTLPFQDIWGDGGQVLAVASDKFGMGGKYIIKITGTIADQLNSNIPTAVSLSSIWFIANRKYYLVGDGIYEKHIIDNTVWKLDPFQSTFKSYPYSVRGIDLNDVVVVGERGTIAHFNGLHWTKYNNTEIGLERLRSVSIKNNLIIAVGTRHLNGIQYYGLIYMGRR